MPGKKKSDSVVTLMEDPYGIRTVEVFEAQNNSDVLPLDEINSESPLELESPLESPPEETDSSEALTSEPDQDVSEPIEEQLDRLSKAIARQAENDPDLSSIVGPSENAEALLEQQILEDQMGESMDEPVEGTRSEVQDGDLQNLEQVTEHPNEQLDLGPPLSDPASTVSLDISEIQSCIEAILFISDKPIPSAKLQDMVLPGLDSAGFQRALESLRDRYQADHHGIEVVEVAGGFQLRTKPNRADLAKRLVRVQTQRLSSGAMETLAIISYQQPIMKEEIDKIRGVDSSYFIRTLIDRKLIRISGRSELPGRPILYSTTLEFLEIFGLNDLASLPPLRELEQMIPNTAHSTDEDPRVREMRRLVGEMKSDQSSALYYNPKEDDRILKEMRERISSIPSSTPYLEDLKAQEAQAALAADIAETEDSGQSLNPSVSDPKLDN